MRKLVRELFFLRRGELIALIVVLFLLVLSIFIRWWVGSLSIPAGEPDALLVQSVKELRESLAVLEEPVIPGRNKRKDTDEPKGTSLFVFDPNTISADSLHLLNLSGFAKENLLKFRKAGGKFKEVSDLKKIYGMQDDDFERLAPYISLKPEPPENIESIPHVIARIPLNTSDSAALVSLPAIGPSFARRIVAYRNLLGGFYTFDQLKEIYGMDSVRENILKKYTVLDSLNIKKINLNTVGYQSLISHPYLTKKEVQDILQYREFCDSISEAEELLNNQILEQEKFNRIRPYFGL